MIWSLGVRCIISRCRGTCYGYSGHWHRAGVYEELLSRGKSAIWSDATHGDADAGGIFHGFDGDYSAFHGKDDQRDEERFSGFKGDEVRASL